MTSWSSLWFAYCFTSITYLSHVRDCFHLLFDQGSLTDCSWGQPKGSLFNSYYIMVQGRALLFFLDCSTCLWTVPYNAESSSIFLSLWYELTWDWTPVSWTIGGHCNHYVNIYIYTAVFFSHEKARYNIRLFIIGNILCVGGEGTQNNLSSYASYFRGTPGIKDWSWPNLF